jgi:dUTP pyrophosphatase
MADELAINLQRLDPDLALPDAGYDLVSAIDVTVEPGRRVMVPTGIAIALPAGYAGFVQPRSGVAWTHGVTVLNAPGLIDAGYRGEIKVVLINHDPDTPFVVRRGDRIAQLVVQQVVRVRWVEVDQLDRTSRGTGGHGSTGR